MRTTAMRINFIVVGKVIFIIYRNINGVMNSSHLHSFNHLQVHAPSHTYILNQPSQSYKRMNYLHIAPFPNELTSATKSCYANVPTEKISFN
jgi:glutamine synthetase